MEVILFRGVIFLSGKLPNEGYFYVREITDRGVFLCQEKLLMDGVLFCRVLFLW